jgi:hypothetical protein
MRRRGGEGREGGRTYRGEDGLGGIIAGVACTAQAAAQVYYHGADLVWAGGGRGQGPREGAGAAAASSGAHAARRAAAAEAREGGIGSGGATGRGRAAACERLLSLPTLTSAIEAHHWGPGPASCRHPRFWIAPSGHLDGLFDRF